MGQPDVHDAFASHFSTVTGPVTPAPSLTFSTAYRPHLAHVALRITPQSRVGPSLCPSPLAAAFASGQLKIPVTPTASPSPLRCREWWFHSRRIQIPVVFERCLLG